MYVQHYIITAKVYNVINILKKKLLLIIFLWLNIRLCIYKYIIFQKGMCANWGIAYSEA